MTDHIAHLQWHPYIGFSRHAGLLVQLPLPLPMPSLPHITFGVVNGLFLGSQVSTNQTFGLGGLKLMGRTTDAGPIAPHVSIPPNNILLIFTILFGESQVMLGASGVRLPCKNLIWGDSEQDCGACLFPVVPLSLNVACHDWAPLPSDLVIAPNNILVGITLADLIGALIDFAIALVVAFLMKGAGDKVKNSKVVGKAKTKGKNIWGKVKIRKATKAAKKATKKALKEQNEIALKLARQRARATGRPLRKKIRLTKAARTAIREKGDAAFNKALKKSTGKLVPALTHGDFIAKAAVAALVKAPFSHALWKGYIKRGGAFVDDQGNAPPLLGRAGGARKDNWVMQQIFSPEQLAGEPGFTATTHDAQSLGFQALDRAADKWAEELAKSYGSPYG